MTLFGKTTIGLIGAVSENGVIGLGDTNTLPFHYKEDMKWFRSTTAPKDFNTVVIMGRKTFESMNSKPLPRRRNIVITRSKIDGTETYPTVPIALAEGIGFELCDIWFIGGTEIYRAGLEIAEEIYLTLIPKVITGSNLIYFPWIDPTKFQVAEYVPLFDETGKQTLQVAKYVRVQQSSSSTYEPHFL